MEWLLIKTVQEVVLNVQLVSVHLIFGKLFGAHRVGGVVPRISKQMEDHLPIRSIDSPSTLEELLNRLVTFLYRRVKSCPLARLNLVDLLGEPHLLLLVMLPTWYNLLHRLIEFQEARILLRYRDLVLYFRRPG